MKIELAPKKNTLNEIKEGEVFKYKYDGDTYYCIKIDSPFTEIDAIDLNTGSLLQLPQSQSVTPVRAKLVIEE